MQPIKAGDGVWQITLPTPFAIGPVNVYIIQSEKITLIDAGPKTEEAHQAFVSGLEAIHLTPESIDQIVLTHHHPDHTGLVDYFAGDIPIFAHPHCEPWLAHEPAFIKRYNDYFRDLSVQMGVPAKASDQDPSIEDYLAYSSRASVDHFIQEGDRATGLADWEVLDVPGHASSHIALYRPYDKLLIGGDLLLEKVSSNAILEPPFHDNDLAPRTLLQYRHSLRKCLDIEVDKVLPGHGNIFSGAHGLILERLKQQVKRRHDVLSYFQAEALPVFTIAKEMFSKAYQSQLDLVLSEIQGHIDWLVLRGDIQASIKDGVVYYERTDHLGDGLCPIDV
ncbi:glyoxylase-like metal-dependent hydrolase (beta-lactamase superfamily II) [Scopulibacillus darangshiensis]|uniref:Glyoxylase-like metal-dependent hydrolase (Beta-lactamase superfamily II) n=1 Tax=Scopulibacillus darangshiensis TaxID=442528 RepID=A0A4V2SNM8_9BACL|nr:MBL fold metallo-hydrolase [Scopulibacillus darangshiensis]TCP31786.1 glyoxylase-like metal-dependent hydrolase (beta-lactamase superfamily II) [Scopulibacillus darangshiensis]